MHFVICVVVQFI